MMKVDINKYFLNLLYSLNACVNINHSVKWLGKPKCKAIVALKFEFYISCAGKAKIIISYAFIMGLFELVGA